MKFLIFGVTGRVGSVAARRLQERGHDVIGCARQDADLREESIAEKTIEDISPECVLNCAAVSGIETALNDPLTAHQVNAMAPGMMARAAHRLGIRFIHLSTDYVLDGRRNGLKDETAKCRPCCIYGESKYEGELNILREMPEALILRVSWVCGNPVKISFAESAAEKILRGESLVAIADKTSLPTNVEVIVRVIDELASRKEVKGIYHLCGTGKPMSWHDYASRIAEELFNMGMLDKIPTIQKQKLAAMTAFRDTRPQHTAMDNSALSACLTRPIPTADAMIATSVNRWVSHRTVGFSPIFAE